MAQNIELLLEAERRGLLPPEKVQMLNEARRRGLVPADKPKPKAEPERPANPTDGMSKGQLYAAGLGKSAVDSGIGLAQTGAMTYGGGNPLSVLTGIAADVASGGRYSEAMGFNRVNREAPALVEEIRERDAPLMDTGAGKAGNISGYALQLVAPAVALRNTTIGRALMPTSVKGNAALGGVMGAVQPAATPEERVQNIGLGGAAGAVGSGLTKLIGLGLRKTIPAFSRGRQEVAAARAIADTADDPVAVQRALASQPNAGMIVPGSRPTLAEMTGDPGLAGLQRTMQSLSPEFNNQMTLRSLDNNASRLSYLRQTFGGADDSAVQAAEMARDRAASPLLRLAKGQSGVQTSGVVRLADRIIENRDKRPAVQSAVREVRELLMDGDKPVDDIQRLLNVRQSIGDMLNSRAGSNSDAAKAATRELLTIRSALDSQMRKASPDYGNWLRTYREGSRAADQIRVGQALTDAGSPIANSRGERMLSPAQFSRAADDLDAVARRATGFRKARADTLLAPEQRAVVDQVRRDLERFANVGREGKAIGSNSVQNAVGAGRIQEMTGPVAAGALTGDPTSALAISGLNSLRRKYGEATMRVVQEALADPNRAAEILSRLPTAQRAEVVQQVAPLLARSAAASQGS